MRPAGVLPLLLLVPSAATAEPAPARNLVLIAIDGLRADHMSVYGYSRDTTPNLERRAKTGVVFDRAFTQASWTLPSFTTAFTSRYPEDHQVLTPQHPAPPSFVFLAQVLRAAGFRTAGFAGGHYLDPIFGVGRGFELYRTGGLGTWHFFRETAPQANRWIRDHKDERFFVFVHGNDVHPPFDIPEQGERVSHYYDPDYRGPLDRELPDYAFVAVYNREPGDPPFNHIGVPATEDYLKQVEAFRASPRDLEHFIAHHDECIREADRQVETVFKTLEELGLEKNTAVFLMADHGLELGEKGKLATALHATVYNSVLHVPLMLWSPGLGPRRVPEPVELVDLAPTALELLGVASPPEFQGKSLAALAAGKEAGDRFRYAFSVGVVMDDPRNSAALYAVQDRRWKLSYSVDRRKISLYDLDADANETRDVAAANPEETARLSKALARHLGRPLPLAGETEGPPKAPVSAPPRR